MDKYYLHCKGHETSIGILKVDIVNDLFLFEPNTSYAGPLPAFLLHKDAPMPMEEQLKMWVLERTPEPNYEFIDALVEKTGLEKYDPYGFFKYNNGRVIHDKFFVIPIQ